MPKLTLQADVVAPTLGARGWREEGRRGRVLRILILQQYKREPESLSEKCGQISNTNN